MSLQSLCATSPLLRALRSFPTVTLGFYNTRSRFHSATTGHRRRYTAHRIATSADSADPSPSLAGESTPWPPHAGAAPTVPTASSVPAPATVSSASAEAWRGAWPSSPSVSPGSGPPTSTRASSRRLCKPFLFPMPSELRQTITSWGSVCWVCPQIHEAVQAGGAAVRGFEHLAFLNFAQNVVCFVWSFLSESSLPPSRAAWLSDCAFRVTSWTRGDRFRLLCVGGDCIRGFLTFLLLFQ